MTIVTRSNGWTFDLDANTMTWPDVAPDTLPIPKSTAVSMFYFGVGYLDSQAARRTVIDGFKRDWLTEEKKTNKDAKLADAPAGVVPKPDSAEYKAALHEAHVELWGKLAAGYEVGVREGTTDPVEEEADDIGRKWLYGLATQFKKDGQPWYTLPKGRKVPRDEDPYNGPKYATFGEALAAFKVSDQAAAGKLIGKDPDTGKAWPFKIKSGMTVAQAIRAEAERKVAEKAVSKSTVALGGAPDEEVSW